MNTRTLGRSSLRVSELCLGTMLFGERSSRGTPPDVAHQLVDRYLDAGGTFIDTANAYGNGAAEEILGRALRGRRHRCVLATNNAVGLAPRVLKEALEGSLRRLQTDHVDLFYVHLWDHTVGIEETLKTLESFVAQGQVRHLGVSNFAAWQVMKCLALADVHGWNRFVAAQYQHSLVVRDIEREFTELFVAEGLGEVVWGPLGGGFLTGKYRAGERPTEGRLAVSDDDHEEAWDRRNVERNWRTLAVVEEVASTVGASASQVALRWLLEQPAVSSVLLGARTLAQLEDGLGAATVRLDRASLARLDAVSQPDLGFPYRLLRAFSPR